MTDAPSQSAGRRLMRSLARIAAGMGLVLTVWWAAACAIIDTAVFPGHRFPPPANGPPLPPTTTYWLDADEGVRVEAWLYLPPHASAGHPVPVVLFFHGNGETIDQQRMIIEGYLQRGVGVFLPEWRGYGRSGGSPSQAAIGQDMRRFRDWLIEQPGVDPRKLIYHGRSLGGGVACDLASRHAPAAMVLESTFTSVTAMAGRLLVPPFLVRHPFRNIETIRRADWPILIMHGGRDTTVPLTHARRNRDAATNSPLVLYHEFDSSHNDLAWSPQDRAEYWRLVEELLAAVR